MKIGDLHICPKKLEKEQQIKFKARIQKKCNKNKINISCKREQNCNRQKPTKTKFRFSKTNKID